MEVVPLNTDDEKASKIEFFDFSRNIFRERFVETEHLFSIYNVLLF